MRGRRAIEALKPLARPRWDLCLAFAVLLIAAYLPAMQGHFLMSDTRVVSNNSRLESLAGLLSIWFPSRGDPYPVMDQYQPLTYTLFWFERQAFGLEARAYQSVSLALHALNSLLVWRLLHRIGARGAMVAAVLFAVHPVHVESVAWIYEQKNGLSGVFFFSSLLAYLRFEEDRDPVWYATAMGCFAAALLAKSSTVVLPGVILLYAWYRGDALRWRTLAPSLPFIGLAALMAALTIWYEGAVTGADAALFPAGALERLARAGWLVGFHAGKVLLPVNLAFFYPLWSFDAASPLTYWPDVAILLGLAIGWTQRQGWGRPFLLGTCFYLGAMFPVMGFFDIFYHQFSLASDHFQYLPSVGLIALAVHAAVVGSERTSFAGRRALLMAAACVACGALWFQTWERSHVFANNLALSRDSATKYPTSWLALQKSGEFALRKARRSAEQAPALQRSAILDLERALALRPERAETYDLLGSAYVMNGEIETGIRHYERAIQLQPNDLALHRNLAVVLEQNGREESALQRYRTMVAIAARSPSVQIELAQALARAGRLDEALAEIDQVRVRASAESRTGGLLREATEARIAILAQRRAAAERGMSP